MEYITIETYRNFENGTKQTTYTFPRGILWAQTGTGDSVEYWTIMPKEFYEKVNWGGELTREYILDKWVAIIVRCIDHHQYFDDFSITPAELMATMRLDTRIFAFIKDSSELGGLLRFGKMETFRGPATYIQLLSHGVVNDPQYGIYNDPNCRPSSPDTFGHGKWIEISSEKAYRIWADLYGWVLDKLVFIDRPCPVILNCNQAYEVWRDQFQVVPTKSKYSIDELDTSIMRAMLGQIKVFADQFFDTSGVRSIQNEMVNPDYENDYIDINE